MEFKNPYILLLLLVLPVLVYFWNRHKAQASFRFPSTDIVEGLNAGYKAKFYQLPVYLRWLAIAFLIIALSGPRKVLDQTIIYSEGIDIVLTLDISGSMAAEDYIVNGRRVNRLDTIKSVVKTFIDERKSDRIGLVVFGSRAYTVCPLTTDYNWLKENLSQVRLGVVEDRTAIGSGIAQSLLRFKGSTAKSKIIILLTDGDNNAGTVNPLTAGKMAQSLGVKIYTIGAGSNGEAPVPVEMFGRTVYQNIPVTLDEDTLKEIAITTHAKYFRASDIETLRQVYKDIDALEKTKIKTQGYRQYRELFWIFAFIALGLVVVDILLANTLLFKIP